MSEASERKSWLPHFWRAVRYLSPHSRPLVIGLIAAVGVATFYTFSISSVVPLLKVIFADHESLADWLNRIETARRLDVMIAEDAPDDAAGLRIYHVQPDSRSHDVLSSGSRIVAIDGQRYSAYELMRFIAAFPEKKLKNVLIEEPDELEAVFGGTGREQREVQLSLRSYHWWSTGLRLIADWLPRGKDYDSRLNTLAAVMGVLVAVSVLGGLCRLANEGLVAVAVQRAMHDLRSQLAEHVLRLPMEWHGRQSPGDTLGRFATDLSKVEVGISTLFGKTIREPIKAAGVLAMTLLIDWKLLAVALLGMPVAAIAMRFFGRQVKRAQKHASQSWGRLLDQLGERLAGIRVVKAYEMQKSEGRTFEQEGRRLTRAQTQIEIVDAATNPALETLAIAAVAGFVLYGGSRVFSGGLEPHLFFAAVVCLGGIFDPVRKMGNVNNRLQAADASARRLFELLDVPEEEPDGMRNTAREMGPLRRGIEFDSLTFAYQATPERLVLDDVSFSVERGQVVAIVGPNGSGKTTLVSLLLRFYRPLSGCIRIDGVDIADVRLSSLRRHIGLVTQDAVVFSGTVRANLAYGADGEVSDAQLCRAAQLAHIEDFIQSLSSERDGVVASGYDAHITARTLSGGQKQRLAIARAMLRDPSILVFDEATSQVDSESERRIQEALDDVTRGRTTFIIAHRFSTIARADMVVVLNEGRVVAVGSHAELLESCPFYVTFCQTQLSPVA